MRIDGYIPLNKRYLADCKVKPGDVCEVLDNENSLEKKTICFFAEKEHLINNMSIWFPDIEIAEIHINGDREFDYGKLEIQNSECITIVNIVSVKDFLQDCKPAFVFKNNLVVETTDGDKYFYNEDNQLQQVDTKCGSFIFEYKDNLIIRVTYPSKIVYNFFYHSNYYKENVCIKAEIPFRDKVITKYGNQLWGMNWINEINEDINIYIE